ncbi:hypothetical protein EJB05_46844, partial [Eragrostis curvula]
MFAMATAHLLDEALYNFGGLGNCGLDSFVVEPGKTLTRVYPVSSMSRPVAQKCHGGVGGEGGGGGWDPKFPSSRRNDSGPFENLMDMRKVHLIPFFPWSSVLVTRVHKGSFGKLYQGIILLLPSLLPDPSSSQNPALATPRSILVLETSTPCPPHPSQSSPPPPSQSILAVVPVPFPSHRPLTGYHSQRLRWHQGVRRGGKASQVSEGKGRSGRRCKRVVAPDRQVHGTRITRQRTRELANSNDTTQKGALEDESQAQDEGTRTQKGGTREDQRQVQEEGTRPILLAEEVTSTQEEGTPKDESQAKDEGTRPILLAEEVTSTQEEGAPEDESQAQDEGTCPILLAEEVISTQEGGTPEDQRQVQEEAEEVTSTQEEGTQEDFEEIFCRPPARPRAGAELHRINSAIENKLAIRIDEGMKRPVIPIQAAKFATEGGMVLRQHIPVLHNWKEYKMDPSYVCDYIAKVSISTSY